MAGCLQSLGGRVDTPLYQLYRDVLQRVWFLRRFGLKTGIDFNHYGLKSGIVFKGTTTNKSERKRNNQNK